MHQATLDRVSLVSGGRDEANAAEDVFVRVGNPDLQYD